MFDRAVSLRREGRHTDSRALLIPLLDDPEWVSLANLHIAWSFDNEGLEAQAVSHYQAALAGGLFSEDRYEALFGLASTLRSLGSYPEALTLFDTLGAQFPDKTSHLPFHAMCLYNVGEHKRSVALALMLVADTSNDPGIRDYQQAIRLYAEDLDRVW